MCYLALLGFTSSVFAQNNLIDNHLQTIAGETGLSSEDISDYVVSSSHTSARSGLTHHYLIQRYEGIEIYRTQSSIHVSEDGSLFKYNNAMLSDVAQKIRSTSPSLNHTEAIQQVVDIFRYDDSQLPVELESDGGRGQKKVFSAGGISQLEIPIKLMYFFNAEKELHLCYDLSINEVDNTNNWWSLKVDATTGEIVDQINWVVECNFEHDHSGNHVCIDNLPCSAYVNSNNIAKSNTVNPDSYNVYAIPVESPNHGMRTLEVDPTDLSASPFGWHDTNGIAGAEFTVTRGNNVNAQEDQNGNNGNGFSADGGANLDFDFPIDFTMSPSVNIEASLTNLFYWNNVIHDVFYQYGFDEASGNFQENNYGNGGAGSDFVNADGLDGSGTNNANFGTPPDGSNPRMQMFLWSAGANSSTTINAPTNIEGDILGIPAAYGPSTFDVTEDVVLTDDGSGDPILACSALVNGADINGKIALIDRGSCNFSVKSLNAQNAGAIAVIICQNTNEAPITMGAGSAGGSVNIPSVMISQADCDVIKTNLPGVNVTLNSTNTGVAIDGSFDNGIITHEYGHGISNRLTGGSANANCLSNSEQMGEGWSDWFGMVMTIEPNDVGTSGRGVGTYAISQPIIGGGIRDFPYSTDLSVDPRTYNDIIGVTGPHRVGSIWSAMLWEMTWALIDVHGYDQDLYAGTGGNNIALALVTEGLKLQPCSPGFVDGRDGILAADQALYGGQNECLIWAAFAKRGLGDGASQGSSNSRNDGTESFTSPTTCQLLDITKTVDKTEVIAGDILTYTLSFENQTGASYTNLSISDTLLSCLSYISGSATNGASFNNGVVSITELSVPAQTTISFSFQALVEPNISTIEQDFIEDVESGDADWVLTNQDPNAPGWQIDDANPFQGVNSWSAENTGERNNKFLTLKSPIKLTSTSELRFSHTYSSLANEEGGKVEISIDNQETWLDLDANFTQNGYDNFIFNNANNPAFGGTNNTGYIETVADLNSFAGESVYLRFTMFHLGNAAGFGWNIDDILISDTEKTIDNTAFFTANPAIDQSINIFPPTDIIPASCTDGIQNGTETGIDTGGSCGSTGPCDFDLVLSGDPAAPGTFQAQNQISSTANVGPNTNYFASMILLENDFEVELGTEFLAEINPCSAFSNDEELALKVVSSGVSNSQQQTVIDINIHEAGKYSLQLEQEDGTFVLLKEQEFVKGVHRVSVNTKSTFTPKVVKLVKQ